MDENKAISLPKSVFTDGLFDVLVFFFNEATQREDTTSVVKQISKRKHRKISK